MESLRGDESTCVWCGEALEPEWQGCVVIDEDERCYAEHPDYKRISAAEFRRTTVGRGPYAQETLMYSFGRIPYSAFRRTAESPDVDVELSVSVLGQTYQARERARLQ